MAITDELQRLQDLKAQGALSEQEFTDAKAALLKGASGAAPETLAPSTPPTKPGLLDPKANAKGLARILVILGVVGGGGWLALRMTAGEAVANRAAATLVKAPIDLVDSVENVKASSWTGLPVNVPYDGNLVISVEVVNGNAQVIHLMSASEIENYKARKSFRHFPDFEADKSKVYKRSGRVAAGGYYLVVEDKTLGILSAGASDVRVKARIEP